MKTALFIIVLTVYYKLIENKINKITLNTETFKNALISLSNNSTFMGDIINKNWHMTSIASTELRADKKFMLNAVSINGRSLEFAARELKSDLDIIKTALSTDCKSRDFIDFNNLDIDKDLQYALYECVNKI